MPGGRLSQQERQQIGLGLADGLAYAEIARRLGRPTSTVTREVMRNGGPVAYRPDLAHRDTGRRAHRRRAGGRGAPHGSAGPGGLHGPGGPHGPGGRQAPVDGRDPDAVRRYQETFTTLFIRQGLPKMMARVLTCLFTTDAGSLTAAELVRHLQVSPASVSKAVAFLERQGLVRRERDERRRDRYVADNDVWYHSMIAAARSHAELAATARQGVAVLGEDSPAAARLATIARFVDYVGESITRAAEQARAGLTTDPGAPAGPEPG